MDDRRFRLKIDMINASRLGDLEGIMRALTAGADPKTTFGLGVSALQLAARGGHSAAIGLLLHHGALVNAADFYGTTALHEAAANDNIRCIEVLLRGGGNPNRVNGIQRWSPLHLAVMTEKRAAAHVLVRGGGDPNLKDAEGRTALDLARSEEMKRILSWH